MTESCQLTEVRHPHQRRTEFRHPHDRNIQDLNFITMLKGGASRHPPGVIVTAMVSGGDATVAVATHTRLGSVLTKGNVGVGATGVRTIGGTMLKVNGCQIGFMCSRVARSSPPDW